MSIKVLVTGANGQLGKTLKALFMVNNDAIDFTFLSKAELDISDKNAIESYFKNTYFDYCINCAAYTNVEQAEKTPKKAFKINAEGVNYLAQLCKETDTILIHISTDYVFDGEKNDPYTETDIPNPINQYGTSKLLGEHYIQNILKNYFIIRTSWLYSKEFGNNFYRTILKKAQDLEILSVTDDQIGCPTNTINLSRFIYSIIKNKVTSYGLKHFCDSKIMTRYDFAKLILLENNLSDQIKLVKAKKNITLAKRPANSVLSSPKLI